MRTTHVVAKMRRIQAIFPETLKNLDGYSSAHMRYELHSRDSSDKALVALIQGGFGEVPTPAIPWNFNQTGPV